MDAREDDFDAELADIGDDRPGVDEVDGDDFTALGLDEDTDDGDDYDDEDADYPEDALEDEIDLVAALYREDGEPAAIALDKELANDLDGLIDELRRVPGEAGAVGVVSIDGDFFVIVRVRGRKVEVLLSDIAASQDWPIARDAADFLGLELPGEDDDSEPVGDFDLFADAGLSELEIEAITSDEDADPLEILETVVEKLGFSDAYDKVAAQFDL
ncbi:MAG: tRNA adenosine deaminase-associated protein [Propioniciclava sp.]|uniref:tRNA adenosine deaminase-associated protein n=1 Tax=Propioniciclava sp. TaxID=2038686 RepID=UPI0039E3C898